MTHTAQDPDPDDTGKSNMLGEILGACVAILIVACLISFDTTSATTPSRAVAAPAPEGVGASDYEALRDRLAADRSIAPAVRRALRDGVVDVVEIDLLAPDEIRTATSLDADAAKRDLIDTLKAQEARR